MLVQNNANAKSCLLDAFTSTRLPDVGFTRHFPEIFEEMTNSEFRVMEFYSWYVERGRVKVLKNPIHTWQSKGRSSETFLAIMH